MKALVKKYPEKGIWMEDVPVPQIGINDVLIKIKKTAICGTDLHIYKWDDWAQKSIKTPITIGHEYVGVVVDKAEGVQNVIDVKIVNFFDTALEYSGNIYNIDGATRNGIIYPSLDPSIFEVRFPDRDILGRIKVF